MRPTFLIAALAGLPVSAIAAPPAGEAPANGAQTLSLPAAISAAYGASTAPADQPLDGNRNPGFTDRSQSRAAEQTYGSTAVPVGADGSLLGDVTFTEAGLGNANDFQQVPDYHVVQTGDTLWDISSYYLVDPYLWPKLWSWNDHVTNAHWIFPGDRIRLFDPFGPRYTPAGPSIRFSKTKLPVGNREGPYLLTQLAFVDADKFDSAMTVSGGADPKVMMGTLDTIYLEYDRGNPPIPGERLVVYSPQEKIYDAGGKKLIGYVVMIAGDIEIESIAREAVEGTIWNSVNPIERGFKVGPLARRFRRVDPIAADTSIVGQIVATMNDTAPIDFKDRRRRRGSKRKKTRRGFGDDVLAADSQFVVVNLGKGTGIKVGNVLEVVRKGDEYTPKRIYNTPYEEGWPRRVIGALLVVQVDDDTALAAAIYSRHEFERGDHVELRGPSIDSKATQNDPLQGIDADANASADSGDGKAKASGGFKLGN